MCRRRSARFDQSLRGRTLCRCRPFTSAPAQDAIATLGKRGAEDVSLTPPYPRRTAMSVPRRRNPNQLVAPRTDDSEGSLHRERRCRRHPRAGGRGDIDRSGRVVAAEYLQPGLRRAASQHGTSRARHRLQGHKCGPRAVERRAVPPPLRRTGDSCFERGARHCAQRRRSAGIGAARGREPPDTGSCAQRRPQDRRAGSCPDTGRRGDAAQLVVAVDRGAWRRPRLLARIVARPDRLSATLRCDLQRQQRPRTRSSGSRGFHGPPPGLGAAGRRRRCGLGALRRQYRRGRRSANRSNRRATICAPGPRPN